MTSQEVSEDGIHGSESTVRRYFYGMTSCGEVYHTYHFFWHMATFKSFSSFYLKYFDDI